MLNKAQKKPLPKGLKLFLYWLLLNVGLMMMSLGVHFFEVPNNFAIGGVGGISVVLSKYITPAVHWLNQPVIMAIINVFLLILGFIILGKGVGLKTLICTLIYTAEVYLLDLVNPITAPLTADPLLELAFAVFLIGGGSAIIFNLRASSGGSDIIALIIKKFTKADIGLSVLIAEFAIACLAFTYGVDIGLYSLLGVFVKTFVIDGVIENITKTKYVTIITNKPEVVSQVILNYIKRGFTSYEAKGGFTGEPRTVILTVCRRSQAIRLKLKLHEEDPESFVIITDANEIVGKGFSEKI